MKKFIGPILLLIGVFVLLIIIEKYQIKKNRIELQLKLEKMADNRTLIKGKIALIHSAPKNPTYLIYNFQQGPNKIVDTSYFEEILTLKETFTYMGSNMHTTILVLCDSLNPQNNFPILRKSWLTEYQLEVPDSLMRYIPY